MLCSLHWGCLAGPVPSQPLRVVPSSLTRQSVSSGGGAGPGFLHVGRSGPVASALRGEFLLAVPLASGSGGGWAGAGAQGTAPRPWVGGPKYQRAMRSPDPSGHFRVLDKNTQAHALPRKLTYWAGRLWVALPQKEAVTCAVLLGSLRGVSPGPLSVPRGRTARPQRRHPCGHGRVNAVLHRRTVLSLPSAQSSRQAV